MVIASRLQCKDSRNAYISCICISSHYLPLKFEEVKEEGLDGQCRQSLLLLISLRSPHGIDLIPFVPGSKIEVSRDALGHTEK
ncbi:hypothetical protein BgiBS90_007043 [Biomphalaria glabrata]|nr:hypothetical protein BgiMline_008724 [Biomphalaria glabrata]KAI8791579.1 hypothetical protein BgiBS90_007043 [Biomphalaria glabrata]